MYTLYMYIVIAVRMVHIPSLKLPNESFCIEILNIYDYHFCRSNEDKTKSNEQSNKDNEISISKSQSMSQSYSDVNARKEKRKIEIQFSDVLKDDVGFELFANYCVTEFSVENILFIFELKALDTIMLANGYKTKKSDDDIIAGIYVYI